MGMHHSHLWVWFVCIIPPYQIYPFKSHEWNLCIELLKVMCSAFITCPSLASSPCASQWPPARKDYFPDFVQFLERWLGHTWCLFISASWCSISSPWLFFRFSSCFCCCCLKYWSSAAFSFLPNAPPASRTAPLKSEKAWSLSIFQCDWHGT